MNTHFGEFRNQVLVYADYLAKGGQQESWAQVLDVQGIDRPDQALSMLLKLYILAPEGKKASTPSELEAFMQLAHSSLHDLLIHHREKRLFAIEGWQYIQSLVMKALKSPSSVSDAIALRDFIFLASDIGLLFDISLRKAIREWLEQLYEASTDQEDQVLSISSRANNWFDPFISLMNQMNEGGKRSNEFDGYAAIENQFVFLPEHTVQEIICHGLYFQREIVREIIPLLVMHPCEELAEATLTVLNQEAKALSAVSLNRLVRIRNWLPETRRSLLDSSIRRARVLQSGANFQAKAQIDPLETRLVRLLASTVDGAGAQNVVALYKSKQGFRSMIGVVKDGIGWVDIWSSPWMTRAECERIIRSFQKSLYTLEMTPDYLPTIIAQGLNWNSFSHTLPHPLLLQWVEMSQLGPLNPQEYTLHMIESLLNLEHDYDPLPTEIKQALDASGRWLRQGQFALGWIESGDHVDDYLLDLNPHEAFDFVDDCVNRLFEPLRNKWIIRFQWLAVWAHSNAKRRGPKAIDFLVMTKLLQSGTPLNQFAFFKDLAVATLSAYTYQHESEDTE